MENIYTMRAYVNHILIQNDVTKPYHYYSALTEYMIRFFGNEKSEKF